MRVVGIDPGSLVAGYGVLEEGSREPRHLESGVIRTTEKELALRLAQLFSGIEEILRRIKPEALAIEEVFFARNVKSALILSHARGVALLAASRAGLKIYEYPARKIKQTVVGHGNAGKEQVRKVLGGMFGVEFEQNDASDALAVALCHIRCRLSLPAGSREFRRTKPRR